MQGYAQVSRQMREGDRRGTYSLLSPLAVPGPGKGGVYLAVFLTGSLRFTFFSFFRVNRRLFCLCRLLLVATSLATHSMDNIYMYMCVRRRMALSWTVCRHWRVARVWLWITPMLPRRHVPSMWPLRRSTVGYVELALATLLAKSRGA